MSIILSTLLQGLQYSLLTGDLKGRITSVEYDSRKITEGSLFVAIKGFTSDGHGYIKTALDNGALCIVADKDRDVLPDDELISLAKEHDASVVITEDTRKAIAVLSANFYEHPEDRLDLVGVTGTKGKTTVTFMLHDILLRDDHGTGLMGTVCNIVGDEKRKASHTTPESHEIYEFLEELARKNFDSCVMEVSSQGLKLDRVHGLKFDVGCFTNLYEDHIAPNEHPDMEDYLNCKLKIFDSSAIGVVNRDCDVADKVLQYATSRCRVYTYGLTPDSDCYATDIKTVRRGSVTGSEFNVVSPWYEGTMFVSLPGKFNVYNALCAICVAGILKVSYSKVKTALSRVKVPGRLQAVDNDLGVNVLVDYAHNAASLENVLQTLRECTPGRIITVFGCGGNRSTTRRFEMGEVSGNLSDYTIITSDNPRQEEPSTIIANIVTGIERTSGKYETETDRKTAIFKAVDMAREGDTVLIAGKGHEDYQIFADRTIHFDDSEVAFEAVREAEAKRR
ncbi:MAG: UDP-N-acetylmuramoyl-L-alanyl-D-glutamate--2,6-diaminopimelate ligase [Saccharofermentans sp.]|nr:UDP-N-acetylmuramoyl-L-alanyl-D-glutamate--2,6-diaminopimelate ligase [Saccharofermentans sp.]